MNAFIDPRTNPRPGKEKPRPRVTRNPGDLDELHALCEAGRLYDVERWIQAGHPLQLAEGVSAPRRRTPSALETALEAEDHALVLLLLCNGYDPNRERFCPLSQALDARRWDLLDLLLEWGTDPHAIDLQSLFNTYDSKLWERFRALGVDLTDGHAIAHTLAHHTSNKPLFGFAKRYRDSSPRIQVELNIALAHHVAEGREKGVLLCLWAGADPHASAPDLRDLDRFDHEADEDGAGYLGVSAIWRACIRGEAAILRRLGPDPEIDDFDELYRIARNGEVIELLASLSPPPDVGSLLASHLTWLTPGFGRWRGLDTLERIFKMGGRWMDATADDIAGVRRLLLKLEDDGFEAVMRLLTVGDYCSREVLAELARTPTMRAQMQKVGFIPRPSSDMRRHEQYRPTRSREVLTKCGIELPKPEPWVPRCVYIGAGGRGRREIQLDRAGLFERVWSTPVAKLAEEWGISGPGLAKACHRLQIPLPPRGYWAKLGAGKRVRRPQLPTFRPGQAEQIIVWAPDESSGAGITGPPRAKTSDGRHRQPRA